MLLCYRAWERCHLVSIRYDLKKLWLSAIKKQHMKGTVKHVCLKMVLIICRAVCRTGLFELCTYTYTMSQKILCRILFVRILSNVHRL